MARGICCIALAVACFAPLVDRLYRWNQVAEDERQALAKGFIAPQVCLPEPNERAAYMAGCLLTPVLLLGFWGVLQWIQAGSQSRRPVWRLILLLLCLAECVAYGIFVRKHPDFRPFFGLLVAAMSFVAWNVAAMRWRAPSPLKKVVQVAAFVGWIVYLVWLSIGDQFYQLVYNPFAGQPWLALPVLAVAIPVVAWMNRGSRAAGWLARFMVGLPVVLMFLASCLGDQSEYAWSARHFNAVFEPVVQVHLGKQLLEDFSSQYGLYPDLLMPLFAVTGVSVFTFTCVCGVLTAGSFAVLWPPLRETISRRGLAVVGFLALVFNGWIVFQFHWREYHPDYFELYFQYLPIRLFFPASAVALTWKYLQSRSRRWYWFAQIWLACGVLWNLDSGIVAQAAWLAALVFDGLFAPDWKSRIQNAARHAAATFAALAGVVAAYALVKFACYGQWPQFAHLFDFQRLFYVAGFCMLPMHVQGLWQLVVLAYLVGLTQAAATLFAGDHSPRATLVFMLSVLGLGLFSYYQGRSHESNLLLCWWPAIFLLPIYWDQLLTFADRQRELNLWAYGIAATLGVFVVSSAAGFLATAPSISATTTHQWITLLQPGTPLPGEVELLNERVPHGEPVLLISNSSPLLHCETSLPTLAPGPWNQMILFSDYEAVVRTLQAREHAWVFVDQSILWVHQINPDADPGKKVLLDGILPRMVLVAETRRGCLYEFRGTEAPTAKIATTHSDNRGR